MARYDRGVALAAATTPEGFDTEAWAPYAVDTDEPVAALAPVPQAVDTVTCTIGPVSIDGVRIHEGDAWLHQNQMAKLFGVNQRTVSEHVCAILADGELRSEATHRSFRLVRTEGNRSVSRDVSHYNTDMVQAVGFRVRIADGDAWLTQKQMAELFGVGVDAVNYHVKRVESELEGDARAAIEKFSITASDGKCYQTKHYNTRFVMHVAGILEDAELQANSVRRNFRLTAADGKEYQTGHYNTDMVQAVGFRVRSSRTA